MKKALFSVVSVLSFVTAGCGSFEPAGEELDELSMAPLNGKPDSKKSSAKKDGAGEDGAAAAAAAAEPACAPAQPNSNSAAWGPPSAKVIDQHVLCWGTGEWDLGADDGDLARRPR